MSALILIAEDEPDIAAVLDAYLMREGFRTVRAGDGQIALDLHLALKPDLVLLDVRMPKRTGWEVLSEIRRRGDTPVMMITALDQDIDKLQALRVGADDYVIKPFNAAEVAARAHVILRRRQGASDNRVLRVGPLEIDLESHLAIIRTAADEQRLNLTLTEFRILAFMARQPMRVFTRGELVDACLPGQDVLERTVDSHLSKLRKKLDEAGAAQLLTGIRGVGYRLENPR
ncbi:MAG: response regulator [Candidatus Brevundimonas colombiensis]|uniref:Response regulator n=1 Tax=Candidatus Brevundimonas colombiensis TaxID=3121376 RepID=A0AAJ6BKP9_9CAUL|nr:response regulator [Brevundimonas sp.]WEK40698.1 MAG: response regulator [Brevundimonas sp.]